MRFFDICQRIPIKVRYNDLSSFLHPPDFGGLIMSHANPTRRHRRTMLRASRLYYEEGLSQQAVAKQLGLSRPTVSKLLKTAREIGMVTITIAEPDGRDHYQLEETLEARYGLKEAVIFDETPQGDCKTRAGLVAGATLERILSPGQVVGISWGTTLAAVSRYRPAHAFKDLTFVPLNGGSGFVANELHGNTIAAALAENFGGHYLPMHAPAMVSRLETKCELMKEQSIKRVLKKAARLDVALTSIGLPNSRSTIIRTGYFTGEMIAELQSAGVCGDICMHFFDDQGACTPFPINEKVIGVDLETLRRAPYAIGVCCGPEKARAIRGALRGGYVNMLITDLATARALADLTP